MIADGLKPKTTKTQKKTLGDTIDKYTEASMKAIGKTKTQVLRTIRKEYDIAEKRCDQIDSTGIVKFAQELHLHPGLDSPATVLNYLSHLSAVFTHAPALWGFDLDPHEMKKAMGAVKHIGVAARPNERDRRPTLQELDRLMAYFATASAHDSRAIRVHRIVAFAIFSTRRQAEICRITWKDYKAEDGRVMVRKMKSAGDKGGLDTWVELPAPCGAIIAGMPSAKAAIFPFNGDSPGCQPKEPPLSSPWRKSMPVIPMVR
ncbi:hypothetical protein [Pseudogemmobacter bohemicus]|uniref:hypothetical protein n=1 Tax=Pseudogemmobacter bohemicus TaxID=2250708 RepID=UPI000DD4A589|nr:hypothetical protein [Pseudogemmobacter bohemicus]